MVKLAVSLMTLPLVIAFLNGCGERPARRHDAAPAPEVKAPSAISGSFLVQAVDPAENEGNKFAFLINKESLDREFLLQSAITIMPYEGTSNGNLSRIVAFKLVGRELWMLETGKGHIVTNDIPQTFVLARFPVKSQSGSHITFDFNAGMSRLFVGAEWRGTDFEGDMPRSEFRAVQLSASYIEDARISGTNKLVIRQIGQTNSVFEDESDLLPGLHDHTTIETKYYLTPYNPNPDFVPAPGEDFTEFGFFEVAPKYDDDGQPVVHATKFADGPITFAVSANTPAEWKQAVVDGIAYWNKTFGADIVKIVDAPQGVVAPDFDYNVVQWVSWDDAGFAYADAQADPRTGETLHAQVYMTSAFAIYGLEDAKDWLNRLGVGSTNEKNGLKRRIPRSRISLNGFQKNHLCFYDRTMHLAETLSRLVAENASDAVIRKVAADTIREVVAHEIGHTLGLRHNFAGSLASNFPVSELEQTFKNYVTNGRADADKITTSSVMEYQTFLNSAMTGDQLVTRAAPLAYDYQAIQKLYTGDVPDDAEPQLYCTDSHTEEFIDCQVFDEGSSVAATIARDLALTRNFLDRTVDLGNGTLAPLVYLLDPRAVTGRALRPVARAINLVNKDVKVLSVRRNGIDLPSLDPQMRQQELDFLLADINANGGAAAVFPIEILTPATTLPLLVPAKSNLDVALTKSLIALYSRLDDGVVVSHPVADLFVSRALELARKVVLAETGNVTSVTFTADDGTQQTLALPEFKYDAEARSAAAGLLKPGRGVAADYALNQNIELRNALLLRLNATLRQNILDINVEQVPADARRWVVENKNVVEGFGR